MTTEEIIRALKRISHQIAERNNGVDDVVIVGIKNGGVPIAHQLADNLLAIEGIRVPLGFLDISMHRDDISGEVPEVSASELDFDITGKNVVLVDDVLFTGRTARAALDAILDFGRPGTVQLAALIDRGHRELPIRADYVGKNIPTSLMETISVDFDESGKPVVNIYDK